MIFSYRKLRDWERDCRRFRCQHSQTMERFDSEMSMKLSVINIPSHNCAELVFCF